MLTCFGGLENDSLTYLINDLQNQADKKNNIFENIRQKVTRENTRGETEVVWTCTEER